MPSQKTLDRFEEERTSTRPDRLVPPFAPTIITKTELKEGFKADAGKPTFTLLPFDALGAISRVLTFGAVKYAARNWEKGMNWTRPWDACVRHLDAWMRREEADDESGMSHLWHAGCCILFLIAFELRGIGTDNRPAAPPADPVRTQDQSPAKAAA